MWLIVYSNDHAPLTVRPIYSSSKLRTAQMMIFSLVAMIGLEKCCITSACLHWLCHSGEWTMARGPLVLSTETSNKKNVQQRKYICIYNLLYSNLWCQKGLPLENRIHKITKIGDSVWLSLFLRNTVVCKAAYVLYRLLKLYLIFKITRMGSMIPKEIKHNLHYDNVRGDFWQLPHGTTPTTRVK